MPDEAACSNCAYGHPKEFEDGLALECRRFPPQLVWDEGEAVMAQALPQVSLDDWCGEHRYG